jgi:hypothetical protein
MSTKGVTARNRLATARNSIATACNPSSLPGKNTPQHATQAAYPVKTYKN